MNSTRQFIRSRREAITKELETWPVQVAAQPRKPMYTVEVGSAKGSFATEWHDHPAANPLEAGRADVQLQLDGQAVTFKQLGSTAQRAQFQRPPFGFGPPDGRGPGGRRGGPPAPGQPPQDVRAPEPRRGGAGADRPAIVPFGGGPFGGGPFGGGPFGQMQPPATVVVTGVRESDGRNLTLTLSVDPKVFGESAGKTINVQGTIADGESGGGFMPFGGGRVVEGQLTLAKVGTNSKDAVEGNFDLKIAETRGGFMDRGAFGRGGRGGPGRDGRGGSDAPAGTRSRGSESRGGIRSQNGQ